MVLSGVSSLPKGYISLNVVAVEDKFFYHTGGQTHGEGLQILVGKYGIFKTLLNGVVVKGPSFITKRCRF